MKYCPNPECPGQPQPGIASEFVDGALRCSDCDTPLVRETELPESMRRPLEPREDDAGAFEADDTGTGGEALDESTEAPDPDAWVPVEAGLYAQEAHIARGILENEGIEVLVVEENLASVLPFFVISGQGARVCVRRTDLERAEEVLKTAETGALAVTEDSEEAGATKTSPEAGAEPTPG